MQKLYATKQPIVTYSFIAGADGVTPVSYTHLGSMNKADKLFIMIVAACACLLYVPLCWSAYRDVGRKKEVVVSYKDREILRKSLSLNDVYTVKGTLGDVQVEVCLLYTSRCV